jgi:hypothetical protein
MSAVVRRQLANFSVLFVTGIGIMVVTNFVGGLLASALHVSNWFIGFPLFIVSMSLLIFLLVKLDPARWAN